MYDGGDERSRRRGSRGSMRRHVHVPDAAVRGDTFPGPLVENTENIEKPGGNGNTDNIENVENVKNVKSIENVENIDNIENVENVENIENIENIEKDGTPAEGSSAVDSAFVDLLRLGVEGLVHQADAREGDGAPRPVATPRAHTTDPSLASSGEIQRVPASSGDAMIRALLLELGDLVQIKDLLRGVSMDDVSQLQPTAGSEIQTAAVKGVHHTTCYL